MSNIAGKVIAITGSGGKRGFGRATALGLAARGAKLVISDIDAEGVNSVVDEIIASGGAAVGLVADVSVYEDNAAIVSAAVTNFGRLDVFVANAGIMPLAFWLDSDNALDRWDACVDINLKGVMYGIAASQEALREHNEGHFVLLSSIYANAPVSGAAVYQATKMSARYLVESLRQEEQGHIKTTIVNPTGVPSTNLMKTVVNNRTYTGGMGWKASEFLQRAKNNRMGCGLPGANDVDSPSCDTITAQEVADAIIFAIDKPSGLSLAEITVRATNELFVI